MSKANKIRKNTKLYYREDESDSIRRLDKANIILYIAVIKYMREAGAKKYEELNKDVKGWRDYQPIDLVLPVEESGLLINVTKRDSLQVFYNTSWRPLVVIKKALGRV